MNSKRITISLVLERLHSAADGRALLELLSSELTQINLSKLDVTEPLKKMFTLDELEQIWEAPAVYFSGAHCEGAISFSDDHNVPSVFELFASTNVVPIQQARRFLRTAALQYGCLFGIAHQDIQRNGYSEILLSMHQLRRGIPDVYWCTIFGEPYVRLIGVEKLISVPASSAELIDHRLVLLELTPEMSDMWERPEHVESVRLATRDHIGEAYFEGDHTSGAVVPPELLVASTDEGDLAPDSLAGMADTARLQREAAVFAQVAASEGLDFAISSKAIPQLDRVIDELWEDPSSRGTGRTERKFVDSIAPVLGSFLGEIIVRELGGTWAVDDEGITGVRLSTGAWTYPHEKTARRFSHGHADSLSHYYAVVREVLAV